MWFLFRHLNPMKISTEFVKFFSSFCQKPNAKWNEIPNKHIHIVIERKREKKSNWNYRVDSFLHVSCGNIWCFSVRLIFQCFNFYVFCLHQHRVALRLNTESCAPNPIQTVWSCVFFSFPNFIISASGFVNLWLSIAFNDISGTTRKKN